MIVSPHTIPSNKLNFGGPEVARMALLPGRNGFRAGLLVAAIVVAFVIVRFVFLQLVQLAVVGGVAVIAAYAGYRFWRGWRRAGEGSVEDPLRR